MTRLLPLALLLLVVSAASALAKPKVCVLGLEVKGTGSIDQTSTSVAHELTEGMRARARKPNGPYSVAANSDKELIDEKLIKSCDDEAVGCMSQIGRDLDADFVIYGKVEKESEQYTVTLHVLNVKTKSRVNTLALPVPYNIAPDKLRKMAKKAYTDLVGAAEDTGGSGTLIVKSNALRGKVMLDDEYQGKLIDGTLAIPGVGEGRWRVGIEAAGYQRKEVSVVIRPDDTTTQTIELVENGGDSANPAKSLFYPTAVLAAGLGVFSLVAYLRWNGSMMDDVHANTHTRPGNTMDVSPADCGNRSRILNDGGERYLDSLCEWRSYNIYGGIVAGVFAVTAGISGYFAFRHSEEPQAATAARRVRPEPRYSVTPILTPQGAAASFSLEW